MSRAKNWRYHAAKRRNFAAMYGPSPTGRVVYVDYESASAGWQGLTPSAVIIDDPLIHADYSSIEARILAHMSMPRDRVRFNLQPYGLDQPTRDAFYKAFGAPFPSSPMGEVVIVVCRPSQFARFMIYRNDFGGKNSFKELSPVLFTPEAQKRELDVSLNPAG
jgi:hypothetical protein